jgi:hypothetical protein
VDRRRDVQFLWKRDPSGGDSGRERIGSHADSDADSHTRSNTDADSNAHADAGSHTYSNAYPGSESGGGLANE